MLVSLSLTFSYISIVVRPSLYRYLFSCFAAIVNHLATVEMWLLCCVDTRKRLEPSFYAWQRSTAQECLPHFIVAKVVLSVAFAVAVGHQRHYFALSISAVVNKLSKLCLEFLFERSLVEVQMQLGKVKSVLLLQQSTGMRVSVACKHGGRRRACIQCRSQLS